MLDGNLQKPKPSQHCNPRCVFTLQLPHPFFLCFVFYTQIVKNPLMAPPFYSQSCISCEKLWGWFKRKQNRKWGGKKGVAVITVHVVLTIAEGWAAVSHLHNWRLNHNDSTVPGSWERPALEKQTSQEKTHRQKLKCKPMFGHQFNLVKDRSFTSAYLSFQRSPFSFPSDAQFQTAQRAK